MLIEFVDAVGDSDNNLSNRKSVNYDNLNFIGSEGLGNDFLVFSTITIFVV